MNVNKVFYGIPPRWYCATNKDNLLNVKWFIRGFIRWTSGTAIVRNIQNKYLSTFTKASGMCAVHACWVCVYTETTRRSRSWSKSVKCPAASVSTYTGTLQTAHRGRKATEMYLAMSWTALSASPTHTVYVCQYKPFQQIFPNAVCCEHWDLWPPGMHCVQTGYHHVQVKTITPHKLRVIFSSAYYIYKIASFFGNYKCARHNKGT